jgi:uncharacterized protein (DUF934 family)
MALLERGSLRPDRFVRVADDAAVAGPAIVTLARLQAGAAPPEGEIGVALPNDADPAALAPFLDRLALIVLHWPKHRDGRAFTQARALRERGFRGAIRATGHLLPDQHAFLLRCGVTEIELPDGADPAPWQAALGRIPLGYQPAAMGDAAPLGLLRRHLRLA